MARAPWDLVFAIALSVQSAALDIWSASARTRNGSYLVPIARGFWDEWILHCGCGMPRHSSRWHWDELNVYAVSNQAHHRGYRAPEEIVSDREGAPEFGAPLPLTETFQ
jgi:hypothetical protein